MNQVKSEEEYRPCTHAPYIQTPVYQQSIHSQYFGLFQGGPLRHLPEGTLNLPSMTIPSTRTPTASRLQHFRESRCLQHYCIPPLPGNTGDLTACQLRNPSSSLPQGVAGASAHSPPKPPEDVLQKRELRLMKNREAARECRRKKKEYVKCLENRVAVLENQNKTLIEELRVLKDIYRHKAE